MFIAYIKGWQTFSLKGHIINILSFAGYVVPVTMTRPCPCSAPKHYINEPVAMSQ